MAPVQSSPGPAPTRGSGDEVTLFFNCSKLQGYDIVRDEVWVQGGKIIDPATVNRHADHAVDCRNAILAPGFLDLQVNGAFGVDFLTYPGDLQEGLLLVNQRMLSTGVTGYCPTLITSPPDYYHNTIPKIPRTEASVENGAGVLGLHLEGPFISKAKKGAHPIDCIVPFGEKKFQAVEDMYGPDISSVSIVTLAPEHEHSSEVIRDLTARNIVVSLGHSQATLDQALDAVVAGATMLTHLFNAMPAFHHRDPSLPGILASEPELEELLSQKGLRPDDRKLFFGIISDGVHTHGAALRHAYRIAPSSLCLVTDALAPMGLPRGEYLLGKTKIEVSGTPKQARVRGTDTLAGCVGTMDFCVRNFLRETRCSVGYALAAATLHPAQCLGIEKRKGTLEYGTDADIVFLSQDLRVLKTFVGGKLAFDAAKDPVVDQSDV